MWWHSKIVRIKLIQNILKVIVHADAFEDPSCIRVLFLFRYENINHVHPIVPQMYTIYPGSRTCSIITLLAIFDEAQY